ncbi:MAG: NB-ARC domain-containing protein [Catenulispora sp.]
MGSIGRDGEPDPAGAGDLAEYIELLGRLRTWAGAPSLRILAKRVGPLLRPPRAVSHSTVGEAFQTRRRRLDPELVLAIVRALGGDVGRWRAAYLRIQHGAKAGGPAGVHRQLPPDLATFTGREAALKDLLAAVPAADGEPRTVVVSAVEGMAGIGKTQLVIHAAHELLRSGRYGDVQLYVNLRGFDADQPPADPAAVLESFLRALEVPARDIPADLAGRAAMFRDRMHGRHALVVLDDAAGAEQVRDLIPADPNCLVLITSRRSLGGLDGATCHTLDVFARDEALGLLRRIVGPARVAAEPEAAERLLNACGHLPLAVALAAARLRSRPAWSLARLADRLAASLGEVAVADRSLQAVFDLSYESLPEPARSVFRLLGGHPGTDFTAESVAVAANLSRAEAADALELLLNEHLVQQRAEDRYWLHDLLKRYSVERAHAEVDAADRSAAVTRLLQWYGARAGHALDLVKPARIRHPDWRPRPAAASPAGAASAGGVLEADDFPDAAAAKDWLDQHADTLREAAELGERKDLPGPAWQLWAAAVDIETNVNPVAAERLARLALAGAARAADPAVRAWLLFTIGGSLGQRREFEAGIRAHEQAIGLARQVGDRQTENLYRAWLSYQYSESGRPQTGLELAEQAWEAARGQGTRAESNALNAMATALHALGRPVAALGYIRRIAVLAEDGGDVEYLAAARRNVGYTLMVLERYAQAIPEFDQAVVHFAATGNTLRIAECRLGAARAWELCGDAERAREVRADVALRLNALPEEQAAAFRQMLADSPLLFPAATPGSPNEDVP